MTDKQTVKFGDICKEIKLTTKDPIGDGYERYIGLEHLDSGSLKIKRWGVIAEDNPSFTRVFKKGQILIGKRRPYLKKAAIAEFDGICSGDIIVIEPKNSQISAEILPFLIQSDSFWQIAISTSSGSLSPRTKFSSLTLHEFELKKPTESGRYQKLLGKCHEISEHLINLQNSSSLAIRQLYLGVFQNFYEKGTSQVEIPDGWKTVYLGDLLQSKAESGYSANEVSQETEHYVLNLNNLSLNGFVSGGLKPIKISDFREHLRLEKGDLLISRANTNELVGLIGIYNSNISNVIFPDTMMRLRVNESLIRKEYLEAYLLSPYGRRAIQRIAAGTSASMKKINKENLSKVKIPLPQLDKQDEIVGLIFSLRDIYQGLNAQNLIREQLRNNIVKEFIA